MKWNEMKFLLWNITQTLYPWNKIKLLLWNRHKHYIHEIKSNCYCGIEHKHYIHEIKSNCYCGIERKLNNISKWINCIFLLFCGIKYNALNKIKLFENESQSIQRLLKISKVNFNLIEKVILISLISSLYFLVNSIWFSHISKLQQ